GRRGEALPRGESAARDRQPAVAGQRRRVQHLCHGAGISGRGPEERAGELPAALLGRGGGLCRLPRPPYRAGRRRRAHLAAGARPGGGRMDPDCPAARHREAEGSVPERPRWTPQAWLQDLKRMNEAADRRPEVPPAGYRPHDAGSLRAYLAAAPALAGRLGGRPADWTIEEVGDGNLNLVFLVHGPAGALFVKQALPYVRLVGESWPLPLSRAHFEHIALLEEAKHAPDLVPAVLHFDVVASMTIMECLDGHIIMRKGMIKAVRYPLFATH